MLQATVKAFDEVVVLIAMKRRVGWIRGALFGPTKAPPEHSLHLARFLSFFLWRPASTSDCAATRTTAVCAPGLREAVDLTTRNSAMFLESEYTGHVHRQLATVSAG